MHHQSEQGTDCRSAEENLRMAALAEKEYKYGKAISYLESALRSDPVCIDGFLSSARIFEKVGLFSRAVEFYAKAASMGADVKASMLFAHQIATRISKQSLDDGATRYDFSNVTFLIPFKYDSPDRARNISIVIKYLQKHFLTNIMVCEDNPDGQDFFRYVEPSLTASCEYMHIGYNKTGVMHRTKQINMMADLARTPVIAIYDTDVLFHPLQYLDACEKISAGYDVVYPYNGVFVDILPNYVEAVERTSNINVVDLLDDHYVVFDNSVGGALFCSRERFFNFGGYNEKFLSWGFEDLEFACRFQKLGARMERCWGPLIHLRHQRTMNSSKTHSFIKDNEELYNRTKLQNPSEIASELRCGKFKRSYVCYDDVANRGIQ